jgi:serine/threonine protein kinase
VERLVSKWLVVCQAVQHAHQKGIIHRDLKPSNVIVTEVDGKPTPKVIDFGVAKATEVKLTDVKCLGTSASLKPLEMASEVAGNVDRRPTSGWDVLISVNGNLAAGDVDSARNGVFAVGADGTRCGTGGTSGACVTDCAGLAGMPGRGTVWPV